MIGLEGGSGEREEREENGGKSGEWRKERGMEEREGRWRKEREWKKERGMEVREGEWR